jgi:hypothetical protein
MRPFIHNGDELTVAQVDPHTLKVNDIIFYRSVQGSFIAHRLVKKQTRDGQLILEARGDSVIGSTEQVPMSDFLGRVASIRRGSKILNPRVGSYAYWAHLWCKMYPLGPYILRIRSYLQKVSLRIPLRIRSHRLTRF